MYKVIASIRPVDVMKVEHRQADDDPDQAK